VLIERQDAPFLVPILRLSMNRYTFDRSIPAQESTQDASQLSEYRLVEWSTEARWKTFMNTNGLF